MWSEIGLNRSNHLSFALKEVAKVACSIWQNGCKGQTLFTTPDEASQYTDDRYRGALKAHNTRPSAGSMGSWNNSVPTEILFGT